MSKSLLQTRIVDKLEVIMTQVDTMNKFGKNIPLIHLDILKSNIRTLYEQICELERAQIYPANGHPATSSIHKVVEKPIITKEVEERIVTEATETITKIVESIQEEVANEFAPEIKMDFEETIKEEIVEEKTNIAVAEVAEVSEIVEFTETPAASSISPVEEAPLLQIETTFEESGIEEKTLAQNPIPDIFSSLQTIADRYKTPDSSLNEAMAFSNVSTVNTAVKQIRDLKSAIGINEKFLFINELFKGNMKEYTDTILLLSDAEHLDAAHVILAPLKERYAWREDSTAYVTLIDFLQRRFV